MADERYNIMRQSNIIKEELENENKNLKNELLRKEQQVYKLNYENNDLNQKINKLKFLSNNRNNSQSQRIEIYRDKYENKEKDIKVFEKYIKNIEKEEKINSIEKRIINIIMKIKN